jgi:flagellar biosynthetic protein FliO
MHIACGGYAVLVSILVASNPLLGNEGPEARSSVSLATPSSGVTIDSVIEGQPKQRTDQRRVAATTEGAGSPISGEQARLRTLPPSTRRGHVTEGGRNTEDQPWYRSGPVALAAVLSLILLATYVARRYVPAVRTLGSGAIQVIQRAPLSSKQSVALVQVGQRMVLIGITSDHISSLSVIDDPEECARLRGRAGRTAGKANRDFDTLLSKENGRYEDPPVEAAIGGADRPRQLRETRGQLEGMLRKLREMRVA